MGDQPTFDAYYYAHSCGRPYARDAEWLRFFATVADRIAADVTAPSFARATEGKKVALEFSASSPGKSASPTAS